MVTRHYDPSTIKKVQRIELQEIAWRDQQAGEDLNQYDVVFRDGSFWKKADASDSTRVASIGIGMAQDTRTSGGKLDIWIKGQITNTAWSLASGLRVFLGSGQANMVTSAPTVSGNYLILIGRALTTTTLEFNPQQLIRLGN